MLARGMTAYPDIDLAAAALILAMGFVAGVANAVAGGGTFFSFPAFLAAGLPPIVANASNAIAVWPGHALAAVGYRRELAEFGDTLRAPIAIAIVGGLIGAFALVFTEDAAFARLVPFLMLTATALFAFGRRINEWVTTVRSTRGGRGLGMARHAALLVFAAYGSFFGAGLGVILMATLLMFGVHDLGRNNALKNLLATVITTMGAVVFAASGLVSWPHTAIGLAGAATGGLLGARVARRLSAVWLRRIVIAVGLLLSAHFFRLYLL